MSNGFTKLEYDSSTASALELFANRFVWWKHSIDAVRYPMRVIAQVMELGSLEDVERLVAVVGRDALRDTLSQAEAGWFSPPSWHFWHYKLGLCKIGSVPPLPERVIP